MVDTWSCASAASAHLCAPGHALQLCLAAAVRAAADGWQVAYLDTSNAVTGRRLAQLHGSLPSSVRSHPLSLCQYIS